MPRTTACLVVLLGLGLTLVAHGAVFDNPPEDNYGYPEWWGKYPYQRNVMLDFSTDIANWPVHPVINPPGGTAWDLDPNINYHMQGTDDWDLYASDWFAIVVDGGTYSWWDDDPFGSDRQGGLLFEGTTDYTVNLFWNLDNWDRIYGEKHIWDELIWHATGDTLNWQWGIHVATGFESGGDIYAEAQLDNAGWMRTNHYGWVLPNPKWEVVHLQVQMPGGSQFAIDSWHAATECVVPEPGSIALFGLGAVGLALWWRRRRQ